MAKKSEEFPIQTTSDAFVGRTLLLGSYGGREVIRFDADGSIFLLGEKVDAVATEFKAWMRDHRINA